ncbi:VOC family protein [Dokdonella soli]|uniref:VOC family protein n=1 Tax=Dokdonella soli TaxID=529810 RepID=A0ABN1IQ70_9GAMM
MSRRIAQIALLVRDYDEAIAWFARALGFVLLEDSDHGGGKRWVRVAPAADAAFCLLLAKATTPEQQACVGRQHGGRVGFFLHTDDFARDHTSLAGAGARFDGEPRHETYGTVVVFEDIYGNRWDLIGPAQ